MKHNEAWPGTPEMGQRIIRTRAEKSSAASLLGEILLVKKRVTSQSSEFLVV